MTASRKNLIGLLLPGFFLLVSVGIGRAAVETQSLQADPRMILLGAATGAGALAVMLMGPVPCIAAIAALTILGELLPTASAGSEVDFVAADLFFVALLSWWLIRTLRPGAQPVSTSLPTPLRGGPVLLFLGGVGLSLLYVGVVDEGRFSVSFYSWLRLVQTASLGWLAAIFLRTRRDVVTLLSAIAAAATLLVVLAVVGGSSQPDAGTLGLRGGGVVQPNKLGLVSGLLLLMGAFGALGPSPWQRLPLALLGMTGLVQSQSVGSLVASSIAVLLGLAFMVTPARRILAVSALRAAVVLVLAIVVAYGLASVIRPSNLPTSEHFRESSTGQRTVLGAAGLEVAERHPWIGVGWRRSETPEVIGARDVNAELRARFKTTKNEFFPDVRPSTVHNAYIQVLADLGLVGLGLFLFMLGSLGWGIKRLLDHVPRNAAEWPQLWFMAWSVLLIAIWWNDNPLYGGQVETVMPALFVGAIAGLGGHAMHRAKMRYGG